MKDSLFSVSKAKTSSRALSFFLVSDSENVIDFDAEYQRGYVWEEKEQQSLLNAIFKSLNIGAVSIIEKGSEFDKYIEVVDGKQRITTICKFFKNEIPYIVKNKEIYFKDLSLFDQRAFKNTVTIAVNYMNVDITEKEKYEYFYSVNFSGVSQTDEHKKMIEDKIKSLSLSL